MAVAAAVSSRMAEVLISGQAAAVAAAATLAAAVVVVEIMNIMVALVAVAAQAIPLVHHQLRRLVTI